MTMLRSSDRLAGITVLAASVACAHRGTTSGERPDRDIITRAQMINARFQTVFDAVAGLHANWLSARGPDSFNAQSSQVRVYLDNSRLGDTATLRSIAVNTVLWVKHYDGVAATGRWALDHGAGVIYVARRAAGADSSDVARPGSGARLTP